METTTTTPTVSKMAKCKDCGAITKSVRETRSYCGWQQVKTETVVSNEFGERSLWVGTRGKLAAVPCKACGSTNTTARKIQAKHTEETCGSKCLSATGPVCECSCDGANHGSNH